MWQNQYNIVKLKKKKLTFYPRKPKQGGGTTYGT